MMRAVVVDDEAPARRRLIRMLERLERVTVVGEAGDAAEARRVIEQQRPDVVLLDIQMPEETGLQLAAWPTMPAIVFVTAYDEHAVEAFELAAIDYLLKPVAQARLDKALARVRDRGGGVDPDRLAEALRAVLPNHAEPRTPRLAARDGSTLHVFDARDIARISARDKYAVFVLDGREYVLDESLTALEGRLAAHEFVRVHRGELVNLGRVVALHGSEGAAELELADGTRAPVSRRLLPEVRRRLGG